MENKKYNIEEEDDRSTSLEEPLVTFDGPYNYADYLKFTYDHMVELIRGKIFKMSPAPNTAHQRICGNLYLSFGNHLKHHPCQVFIAPFDVVLPLAHKKRDTATTVVQPDLVIVCNPDIIEDQACFGVPEFVVEILSPHTTKKDIQLKYSVYEEAGIKEYWIVMPTEKLVEVFVLKESYYQRINTYTSEDSITPHTIPDLTIELREIFPS